jgi:DNA-binding response OmpR family regulator
LIDGDREAGRLLTSRLDKCGVETLLAFDSTQGFEIACREEPSVIILDFPMLKGDPYFLLSRLRSTPTTTNRTSPTGGVFFDFFGWEGIGIADVSDAKRL